MEGFLRFVEQGVNSSVTALEHIQHHSHVAYLQLLQSDNPAAKQVAKVISKLAASATDHSRGGGVDEIEFGCDGGGERVVCDCSLVAD